MRFRKIAQALLVCMALGAFAANAAQAAAGEGWTIGATENQTTAGTLLPSGTHERIACKKHGKSALVFTSSLLGAAVELTAEGIDCVDLPGSLFDATIDNTTSKGHSEGALTFTGVKVVKPKNCEILGGDITTRLLTDEVIMDPTEGSTVVFDKFFPEASGFEFAIIEFAGAECTLAGNSAAVKGTACGEAVHTGAGGTGFESNKTGTLTRVQTLLFGEAQQKTSGCGLTFGKAAAVLSGAVDNELASGKPFGAD